MIKFELVCNSCYGYASNKDPVMLADAPWMDFEDAITGMYASLKEHIWQHYAAEDKEEVEFSIKLFEEEDDS